MNRFLLTDFNKDTLEAFFEFSKLEGEKVISLSTLGGSVSGCSMMIDIINKYPEDYKIEVSGNCYSVGFTLITLTKCKVVDISKQYNNPTAYMHHATQLTGYYNPFERKQIIEHDYNLYKDIAHALTNKQKRRIKKYKFIRTYLWYLRGIYNDDTYLSYEQMKLLLGDRFEVR